MVCLQIQTFLLGRRHCMLTGKPQKVYQSLLLTRTVFSTQIRANFSFLCQNEGHVPLEMIRWIRPSEFVPLITGNKKTPTLFVNGADSGDIVQGALGDCWFLSAIACVAPRRDLLLNLFASTEYSQKGIYTLRFFKHGKWKLVTIDDRIPCTPNGEPLYAHGAQRHETWVMLLEKAYAKINGRCYQNLNRGAISYALKDLTGGDPQVRLGGRGGCGEGGREGGRRGRAQLSDAHPTDGFPRASLHDPAWPCTSRARCGPPFDIPRRLGTRIGVVAAWAWAWAAHAAWAWAWGRLRAGWLSPGVAGGGDGSPVVAVVGGGFARHGARACARAQCRRRRRRRRCE